MSEIENLNNYEILEIYKIISDYIKELEEKIRVCEDDG